MRLAQGSGVPESDFSRGGLLLLWEFPDLQAIALGALGIKIGCAVSGTTLGIVCLHPRVTEQIRCRAWRLEAALGVTALCAAAVLRWFS